MTDQDCTQNLSKTNPQKNFFKFASLYQLSKHLDKDPSTLSEIIIEFVDYGTILIETIKEGILEKDLFKILEACHTLRMISYAIGAMRLSTACFEFLDALHQKSTVPTPQATKILEALFIDVCDVLQQELDQIGND